MIFEQNIQIKIVLPSWELDKCVLAIQGFLPVPPGSTTKVRAALCPPIIGWQRLNRPGMIGTSQYRP